MTLASRTPMSAICHGPKTRASPLANFSFVYVVFFITILLTHQFDSKYRRRPSLARDD